MGDYGFQNAIELQISDKMRDKNLEIIEYLDTVEVMIFNNQQNYDLTYIAIDDIFQSFTGKHYMKVLFEDVWIEISLDKINSVYSHDDSSYVAKNWVEIKMNIQRMKKLERLI